MTEAPRPSVSVVMPFAGTDAEAEVAILALGGLQVRPGDERILAVNGSRLPDRADPAIRIVEARGERSPAHARNVGAAHAGGDWLLFLDADCRPPADLIDRYFSPAPESRDGALAGGVRAAPGGATFAARYGAARSFLDQGVHLAHPYLPRAVAANLLVRRAAFVALGGFSEGLRAAEDTDFSWRLQRAGWRLSARPEARVEHVYRTSLRALRAQWRGYAAGRAWLGRRYEGFSPEPALRRAARRGLSRIARRGPGQGPPRGAVRVGRPAPEASRVAGPPPRQALERAGFAAVDALLGVEELVGLALSNRPPGPPDGPARVVLVADRYPVSDDPLTELAATLTGARVEAAGRPVAPAAGGQPAGRTVPARYREDDGAGARWRAVLALVARHPLRCLHDMLERRRDPAAPPLRELAPVVARVRDAPAASVRALGDGDAAGVARRVARLAGRRADG